ncbi:MAG: phospholipid carrier-dependent glycosyltransferase, partial [Anaerolineales bacterium]|nr:phospholipid carrier-dependent glycosyltransferase [Anaerolineales bacterium]
MQNKLANFFIRNESLLPAFLFLLFLAVSIPGVKWGTPNLWNPDELVWRVNNALGGEIVFDETEPDFNYPSLPKYVMYGIGKITYGLGYSSSDFIVSARVFSALLGALSGVIIYQLAKTIGANALTAFLAGMLYIASGVAPANGRFAHNDLYLQFFSIICVYFAIKYQFTKARAWIYGSFLFVGLAASSKFTGGSLLLVPLIVFIFMNWTETRRDLFRSAETILIGAALCYGGYVVGTPKAFLWVAYYFKRVIPALLKYPQYGFNSSSSIGLLGQWGVFESAVGTFAYFIFIFSFIWFAARLILRRFGKAEMKNEQAQAIAILMMTVLIFDLPFLTSVNYIPRYFIPFVPFLSILGALFVDEVIESAKNKKWNFAPPIIILLLAVGISYSLLRLTSAALLFMHDARMPAGDYIAALPSKDKTIEYTL